VFFFFLYETSDKSPPSQREWGWWPCNPPTSSSTPSQHATCGGCVNWSLIPFLTNGAMLPYQYDLLTWLLPLQSNHFTSSPPSCLLAYFTYLEACNTILEAGFCTKSGCSIRPVRAHLGASGSCCCCCCCCYYSTCFILTIIENCLPNGNLR